MMMNLLFLLTIIIFDKSTPREYEITLKSGEYLVKCYGGQGGGSHNGSPEVSSKYQGGKGAYVFGTMHVNGTGTKFYAFVGGKGKDDKEFGPNEGGFNGGGRGGFDTEKDTFINGGEGPGGGGGASDLRIFDKSLSNRIIVAAGGSGAAGTCGGAPGGDLNGWITNGKNNLFIASNKVTQTSGNKKGVGSNGINSSFIPSSGGGGGWRGGISGQKDLGNIESGSYKSVSHSGSSYISGYKTCIKHKNMTFKDGEMITGYQSGNGRIIIKQIYNCSANCYSCSSATTCLTCFDRYNLYNNSCRSSCPSGYYSSNKVCKKCSTNCKTCVTNSTNCKSCNKNYYKYKNKCYKDKCPKKTYQSGSNCYDCSSTCDSCHTNSTNCDKCSAGYYFYNNMCYANCSSKNQPSNNIYLGKNRENMTCNKCKDENCIECEDDFEVCTKCASSFHFENGTCVHDDTEPFSESSQFTGSSHFSFSSYFESTSPFSFSSPFTYSSIFSESTHFSVSSPFSFSSPFTYSSIFSESSHFSVSSPFSKSNQFSDSCVPSKKFTKSDLFSQSKDFSKSDVFPDSKIFTESIEFSKSSVFSKTNQFSKTDAFSLSNKFSDTGKFTKSNCFDSSEKFTESNEFSNSHSFTSSIKFSETEKFSISQPFTISKDFSKSNYFNESTIFSNSGMFSNSNKFTLTLMFSKTNEFSRSDRFSHSNVFNPSNSFSGSSKFTNSKGFSKSKEFSSTNAFSQTNKFSKTTAFSNSKEFSKSQEFLPSLMFGISNPSCEVFDDDKVFILYYCNYTSKYKKLVYVYVISTNFTKYEREESGSAVHLIDCGIHCNNTQFVDCSSFSGGGGAIYIDNSFNIQNNATFIDVLFLRCKANYGGAVFIRAVSDIFNVSFTNCRFESNKALAHGKSHDKNFYLFGGNAVFSITKQLNVYNCTFVKNAGETSAFKIYNKFDVNTKEIQLEENYNLISFVNCNFEQDEKSKSSINYFDENSHSQVEVVNCNFKGKTKKGTHYISSKLHDKKKIQIKTCNFENDKNDAVNIESFDKEISFLSDEKSHFIEISNILILIVTIIAFIAISIVYINVNPYHKRLNSRKDISDELNDESEDNQIL